MQWRHHGRSEFPSRTRAGHGQQVVKAQVPMSEMLNYQSTLNSITAARGTFHMQFSHYDPVPSQIAQKIIQQAKDEGRIRVAEED
jgi:elongation factor G